MLIPKVMILALGNAVMSLSACILAFLLYCFLGEASATESTGIPTNANSKGINAANERAAAARERRKRTTVSNYSSFSVGQQGSKGVYYDPIAPRKIKTYTCSFTYEYAPNPTFIFGLSPSYTKSRTRHLNVTIIEDDSSFGLSPFASYFLTPQWLVSAQGSAAYTMADIDAFSGDSPTPVNLDQRGTQYSGAGYLTWLAPDKPVSGSVSAGVTYSYQRSNAAIDDTGTPTALSNSQRGGVALSGALSYKPAKGLALYFQTGVDYSTKLTRQLGIYRPESGRQRVRIAAGPGVSYKVAQDVGVSLGYTRTQGYGYYREHQLALQARILL